jgi:hypothetical protein
MSEAIRVFNEMREETLKILSALKSTGMEEADDLFYALPFLSASVILTWSETRCKNAEEVMSLFFETTRGCLDLLRLEREGDV